MSYHTSLPCFVLLKRFLSLGASVSVEWRKRNYSKYLKQKTQCRKLAPAEKPNREWWTNPEVSKSRKPLPPSAWRSKGSQVVLEPRARVTWQKPELWPHVQRELEPWSTLSHCQRNLCGGEGILSYLFWLWTPALTLINSAISLLLFSPSESCGRFVKGIPIAWGLSHPLTYGKFSSCHESVQLKLSLLYNCA